MSMHTTRNYFKEYKQDCDVWIETGTYMGGGVTLAIEAGFTEIHTVDLKDNKDPNYKHGMKINYYYGDSPHALHKILSGFSGMSDKKAMFWLDAHSMLMEGDEENYPLMRELEVIKEHYYEQPSPVILIDDYLYMSNPLITGWTYKDIERNIRYINKDYKIEYLPNPIINNILIAYV